jgi:predicted ABC-type ATPase
MNPQVIIIAGPNGAGKSTLAPYLLKDAFGLLEYVNADTIALGLSAFSPESVAFRSGRIMLERLHDLARAGASFAFETTLASRSYAPWIGELKGRGYGFHLLYLWLRTPELAVERVKERVRLGGHDVPEETILRRYRRGLRNFFALFIPLADTWAFYDNSMAGDPVTIATGKGDDNVTIHDADSWRKVKGAAQCG